MAYQDRGIASHIHSYGREEEVLDPHHYLPVLLKKPGAFARATPILKWPRPAVYEAYYRQLQEQASNSGVYSYEVVKNVLCGKSASGQKREPDPAGQ